MDDNMYQTFELYFVTSDDDGTMDLYYGDDYIGQLVAY